MNNVSQQIKVLFVVSSLNTGGAQRVLSNIVTHLPDGWHIDILLNSSAKIVYPFKGNVISLGMKEPKDRSSWWYQLKVLLHRLWILKRLNRTRGYVACVSFFD